MNTNQKLEQIWGFRRNIESSSDESKSNSDVEKCHEKLSLVPPLASPENDRVSEADNRHDQAEKKPKRTRNAPKKERKNKKEVKSKLRKDSCASSNIKKRENNIRKKKSKFISQTTVSDDFKIFTESILDDLRVARETMFAKMRKEMDQLVNTKPHSRSKMRKGSGTNATKKPNQKPRARKPTKMKQKTEGNYSGLQGEERFRGYGPNNAESSCVGNVYPVGLNHHQRFDNSNNFGIPNRGVQELSHDGGLFGTRVINGGSLRYNAGLSGHNIPNHIASTGFRSLYPN
ncbi:hypothetical protein E3N88_26966 [Mikania micrantha]|uniref:Uncharacterized protein n=1 Tax=Mikania micrantha TaxID=192012 RepID=A0A5N6MY78_9ASTR|nr:hypothetical protein E3N88_26966 [Mikania micrantha]